MQPARQVLGQPNPVPAFAFTGGSTVRQPAVYARPQPSKQVFSSYADAPPGRENDRHSLLYVINTPCFWPIQYQRSSAAPRPKEIRNFFAFLANHPLITTHAYRACSLLPPSCHALGPLMLPDRFTIHSDPPTSSAVARLTRRTKY